MSQMRAYHPPDTLAPWAEIVSGAGPARVEDLLTLPDDGWIYEVVEGVLVRMAGSKYDTTTIAVLLAALLLVYARPRRLGAVTGADGVFAFPGAETGLLPDVGFIVAARLPLIDRTKVIPFPPDLAVEVSSPTQSRGDMAAKARIYLGGGTRLVWVVWPKRQEVDIWRPGDLLSSGTLRAGDSLDGEDVVPGFAHPVTDLFVGF